VLILLSIGLLVCAAARPWFAPEIAARWMGRPLTIPGKGLLDAYRRRQLEGNSALKLERIAVPANTEGVTLAGWFVRPATAAETASAEVCVVAVHGICDNKSMWAGMIPGLVDHGFDVCAFDLQAHGETEEGMCTYGYRESQDIGAILSWLRKERGIDRFVLLGHSLGAASVLLAIDGDPGIIGIVAIAPFADMQSTALHYAQRFTAGLSPPGLVRESVRHLEGLADFDAAYASPLRCLRASSQHPPLLLLHGTSDKNIPPEDSEYLALAYQGTCQRYLIEGATHYSIVGKRYRQTVLGLVLQALERWQSDQAKARIEMPCG
jgi:alpha-beta hydrolase superfamily lysophospholipase